MRRRIFLGLVSAALWSAGCSSGETPADAGSSSSGTGGGGGQASQWPQFKDGPVEFSELLSGASWKNAFVQPGARRLVSFPAGISSTLQHLLVTELGGAQAKVHSVAVQGTLPSGWIEAVVYEPSLDAFVVMMLSDQPRRVEVVTLKIDATTATFATVVQSAPVDPKYLFALAATGSGGVVVAQGSAGMQTLTIKGTAGTWGAPVVQAGGLSGPLSLSTPSTVVPDPAKGRLLAFGADVVDPVQMKPVYHAGLYEMVLAPPYAWNEIALAGSGPPDDGVTVGFTPGLVLDKTGNRAFVRASVKADCAGMPCFTNQTWSADFAKTAWSALDASVGSSPGTPWAVDDEGRRTLASQGDQLLATSLADADLFKSSVVPQDGLLGSLTDDLIPAAILPDGRLITIDFTMRVLDLKSAAPRWDRFGTATPSTDRPSGQLAVDAESGAVYTLVGPKNDLQIIAADGSSIKDIPTTGAPPARSGHGTLFIQKTLYLAGGSDANGATLDDVWALDLGSSAWKRLASLPMGMTRVTLRTGADGELLALGYLPGTTYQMGPVVSIDIHKGTTHALEAKGDVPPQAFWTFAPLGTGFVGIEGGGVVGDTLPNRWTVVRDGDAMTWSKTGLVETGYAITGLVGAGATDGQRAAFVGSRVFEAKIQSAGI